MSRLLAIKVLQAIPVLLLVSVLAFLLMSLLPGDPAVVIAGDQASPEAIEKVRRTLGVPERLKLFADYFVRWLRAAHRQYRAESPVLQGAA